MARSDLKAHGNYPACSACHWRGDSLTFHIPHLVCMGCRNLSHAVCIALARFAAVLRYVHDQFRIRKPFAHYFESCFTLTAEIVTCKTSVTRCSPPGRKVLVNRPFERLLRNFLLD